MVVVSGMSVVLNACFVTHDGPIFHVGELVEIIAIVFLLIACMMAPFYSVN